MSTLNIVLKCIGVIIIAVGVVFVYDARKLTNKFFGTADINVATRNFKILGLIVGVIGSAIVIFT